MIPIVSIVGKSGSGKTTLIENLIPLLKQKGYRIGTIKHDAHRFEIDREGKDSWRMAQAGADTVVVSGSGKLAMVKAVENEIPVPDLAGWLFTDVDLILAEGYKLMDFPKIEVVRFNEPVIPADGSLIALVDNTAAGQAIDIPTAYDHIPRFKFDETQAVAALIEQVLLYSAL